MINLPSESVKSYLVVSQSFIFGHMTKHCWYSSLRFRKRINHYFVSHSMGPATTIFEWKHHPFLTIIIITTVIMRLINNVYILTQSLLKWSCSWIMQCHHALHMKVVRSRTNFSYHHCSPSTVSCYDIMHYLNKYMYRHIILSFRNCDSSRR